MANKSALLSWVYDCTNVLMHVASHARHRPLFHGTCVTPSGRFPPLVHNECSSRVAKVPVLVKARHSRSLSWLWRQWRPEPRRQDRPWWPSTATVAPQTHTWGWAMGAPRRKPKLFLLRCVYPQYYHWYASTRFAFPEGSYLSELQLSANWIVQWALRPWSQLAEGWCSMMWK